MICMPQTSNWHACATGGQGCGEVERLDVACQLVDGHELQGIHAERPRRFHILSAIVNEKTFFRSGVHYFQTSVKYGGAGLGELHFRGKAHIVEIPEPGSVLPHVPGDFDRHV